MLRIGVVGTGGMGARHVSNVATHVKDAEVVAVFDPASDRARVVAEAAGARAGTLEDILAGAEVDAVVVASPDATHASLALRCIEAGKPVLIEKPLGISADEARSVVDAELDRGMRLVQVGLMREFDPQHIAVKQSLEAGEIGRPLAFRGWHRNPPQDPRPSTRHVVFSSAVHDIHSARWLLDSDPIRIYAAGVPIDPETNDGLELQLITMEMANGTLATIEVNADCGYGYEVGVEVAGTEGAVSVPPSQTPVLRRGQGAMQRMEADWLERFEIAYVNEVVAWVESIISGDPVGASAWDGYMSLLAADAVVESLSSGNAVSVESPLRPTLYSARPE